MGYRDLDELRAHWNEFAPDFEATFERATCLLARSLIEHLRLGSADAVLEVGAGPGAGALAVREHLRPGARLVVTDIATKMVELARAKLPADIEVLEADAEALPFADASFDRLLGNLNLMLVFDPDRALAEAHRVLRPGARAAWSVWGRPSHSAMFTVPPEAARKVGIEMAPSRSNFHLGDRQALRAKVLGHGFRRALTWYQAMMYDLPSGAAGAAVVVRNPRWRKLLATQPEERVAAFQAELEARFDELLAAGTPIGLDALMLVADK
ncbi:class I SAM-dependent methyltransferase [Haliangium sp.]|uniref:class I SAM-dependent methyltransferase n=1 Tax=Haliangium sp. TaxID=2663208 RepID=UPI003D0C3ADA